jgi:23S rRNA (uracil1939-C5)-methyltransferase
MVRGRVRSPKIGLFELGTHRIVDIPNCAIHHPLINEVARAAKSAIHGAGARPYNEQTHEGLIRAIQIVVEGVAEPGIERAQVVVVANDESSHATQPVLDALERELGPRLHSLFWNGQPERSNAIIGPLWERRFGPEMLEDDSGGTRVFYPPGAFGQANARLTGALVERLYGWIREGANVAEFYAGVGAIGLGLVERARGIAFNEIGAHSLDGLRRGIAVLEAVLRDKTEVVPGEAGGCTRLLDGCDTTIVDPPRRGLDVALRESLANDWQGQCLVYVSCGVSSFLADTNALLASGRWRLAELVAFGFFPFTEHVETLARFERAESR